MTKEARKKSIEIGGRAAALYYCMGSDRAERRDRDTGDVMFLLAYAVLSVTTYWEQLKKLTKKQFLDENLLMIIATAGGICSRET